MKTKIMKALALAAGMFAAAFAYAGDIYDIRPCDQFGLDAPSPAASLANPAGAGTNFYFRVRLQNQQNSASEYVPWVLTHIGANSEAVDWAVAEKRPNIGVYVSGRLVWAELVSTPQVSGTNGEYTDLIYKYTTKQGDFALPMLLATASGPASDDGAGSYIFNDYLLPQVSRTWSIARQDDATTEVEMNFYSGPGIGRSMDYSLSKAGFYVQTINFDDKAECECKAKELAAKYKTELVVRETAAGSMALMFCAKPQRKPVGTQRMPCKTGLCAFRRGMERSVRQNTVPCLPICHRPDIITSGLDPNASSYAISRL